MGSVKGVVFDLDGTLLDTGSDPSHLFARHSASFASSCKLPCHVACTESFVTEAVRAVVEAHGKSLTPQAMQASTGRRPIEAWQAVKDILDIDATAQQLFDESEPILTDR